MSVSAAASEPSPSDATRVDGAAARAALRESASWWSAKARHEPLSIDRLWACFSCGACEATFDRVFTCPESDLPLYRNAGEVEALIAEVQTGRSPLIDAATWRSAAECECRAPHHHVSVGGAGLFHSVIGGGAGVVATRIGGTAEWHRLSDGSGVLEPFDAASLRSALGRPLTLFEAWSELAPRLPVAAETVVGTAAEPGVWLFAAASAAALDLGIQSKLGARARIVVRLEPSTARAASWPPSLGIIASVMEEGAALAIVVERDAMLAQARAWARSRLGCDVRVVDAGRWALASDEAEWPIAELPIALAMTKTGRTLGEAVASALTEAARAIEDRIATLRALIERVPGASFDVEGGKATARLADGRAVRTIELAQLPAGAQSLSAEVLAQEAAFLFDVAPPWADRSRVCPCGAALSIESRLVAWPWAEPRTRPRVVRMWAEDGRPGAAEVVALCCDRHVRIPSEAELRELGIDGARLEARLDADLAATRPRVHASIWRSPDGERVAIVRGPFVSGFVLSDARARALYDALRDPLEATRAIGWAIGSDLAVLVSEGTTEVAIARALAELGIPSAEPFWLRREVDLGAAAIGSFDVVMVGAEQR